MTQQDIDQILDERRASHGEYVDVARLTVGLWSVLSEAAGKRGHLLEQEQLSLWMVQHKIARILSGDPDFEDHWRDISGYACLAMNALEEPEARLSRPFSQDGNWEDCRKRVQSCMEILGSYHVLCDEYRRRIDRIQNAACHIVIRRSGVAYGQWNAICQHAERGREVSGMVRAGQWDGRFSRPPRYEWAEDEDVSSCITEGLVCGERFLIEPESGYVYRCLSGGLPGLVTLVCLIDGLSIIFPDEGLADRGFREIRVADGGAA